METKEKNAGRGWLSWVIAVAGWLVCAVFCLFFTISLEAYPYAYDMLFPAAVLLLFGNIFIFLFISSRWAKQTKRLFSSVLRVCIGECCILALLFAVGKYGFGY